ncbi:MAG: MBL fold metallo-hydrolase [Tannerellaceae bacterium]|nr:MBL fold metallo-hydrolase [Tannerellaceae bacterium]
MKITLLGSGTSGGVPEIGCRCRVCTSTDPCDNRLRTSALIETEGKNILIDCGPDFRYQLLRNRVDRLDAVLLTHEHYDHTAGLDDLRPLCREKELDIYAEQNVIEALRCHIPYVFTAKGNKHLPHLAFHTINEEPFVIKDIKIMPIRLMHASLPILGYRMGNMAFLSDLKYIPEQEFTKLRKLDVLFIEALRKEWHISHETLEDALRNIEKIAPRQAYLIHMNHQMGLHAELEKGLPPGVSPGYDQLMIEL